MQDCTETPAGARPRPSLTSPSIRRRAGAPWAWTLTLLSVWVATVAALLAAGCDDGPSPVDCAATKAGCTGGEHVAFANEVVQAPGHTGEGNRDASLAVNGVRGGGDGQGSLDVFSLGYELDNSHIVLRWTDQRVLNGPGADFAVFENGFKLPTDGQFFMDLIVIDLSIDGLSWVTFPHDYVADDPQRYSKHPDDWVGFAGKAPVKFNADDPTPVDPFDVELAGGDHFDLDDLPTDDPLAAQIRADGFTFIRLTSASARINPDTNVPYPRDFISDGPDIDGVYGRYVVTE